ncbi:hypothetical protein RCL1_005538 [Eukaryota sp. TZLM3-RCL]
MNSPYSKPRKLKELDFECGFIQLLSQLTDIGDVSLSRFRQTLNTLPSAIHVYVIENKNSGKVVATATLLVEQKFIHSCGSVGHIEDVVVASEYRGRNLGRILVQHLSHLAESLGCYKTILDCSSKFVPFYEKCGFSCKGSQMSVYY